MTLGRFFVLLALLIGGAFVGLVNGQPIFYYDTVAYIQGPDAAIGRLLGDNFRSRWTRKINTSANPASAGDSQMRDRPKEAKADSEGTIIGSGRSIYYGMFLYLSYFITSHFWFTVFIHSAIFVYLCHTLICACLNWSFHTFAWMSAAILVLSPVGFTSVF